MLRIQGDGSKEQLTSAPLSIGARTDYVLKVPVRIEQGRVTASVVGVGNGHQYASAIVEAQDWKTIPEQPLQEIEIPFVSGGADQVKVVFANAGAAGVIPVMEIGQANLYSLGPASFTWTRIPRALFRLLQKLFVTAVMLPLAVIGLVLLIGARRRRTLVILLVVPAYYLLAQSALHTEYRYVLAIHYFLFVLVAVALHRAGSLLWSRLRKLPPLRR